MMNVYTNPNGRCEDAPCCGCCGVEHSDTEMEAGWPGDGSGMDDLADYNANEADDYADEGADDRFFPGEEE